MDYLVITGPVNAAQLHVPRDVSYKLVQVHPKGKDIGSNAMQAAMADWLGGKSIRDRLPDAGKIGVIWFSAGHGSVRSILKTSKPEDVNSWLCIDGLYGDNKLAVDIIEACRRGETTLMATASTSTPGQYAHSLDRWRDAIQKTGLPELPPDVAAAALLPRPDFAWGSEGCLVAGYNKLGHHDQVPATRKAFMSMWDSIRTRSSSSGTVPIPTDSSSTSSTGTITIVAAIALVSAGLWFVARRKP
jgi:hypothetical protein